MINGLYSDEILKGLQVRDRGVFAIVYEHFYPVLFATAHKYVSDKVQAEEIVQDVFLHLWEKEWTLEHATALKSYLYRAVINRAINHLQRNRLLRKHHSAIQHLQEESYLCTFIEEQELRERIHQAVSRLPEKCQQIFKLSRFEGLKNNEIAHQLNLSVKTVENQMTIALKQLKAALLDDPERPVSAISRMQLLWWLFAI
ncbi:RNA polymerase sigma-70 factor [Chitinophaga nivalis]|uniref:RNA polymerase sigma-70 factor n=1 Tax=Chitinophaga nivalis TaxID=2991709 RepID=A0ABT3ITU3_9BACT|nr:RNA polymerase sigma-70 factor [Chitinophaga nivalis]MCW3462946.1 RNA polymerase sigma-70 factor [Chitinophaga nivalis]MCW3487364.1 RNA polymerase sigma-70 factor [Chitinophaga nivalis]